MIPTLVEHQGEQRLISDFPDFEVYSDVELARVLNTTITTVRTWKKGKIINFTKSHGYTKYRVCDVINSLKAFGYIQENIEGQPTAHHHE